MKHLLLTITLFIDVLFSSSAQAPAFSVAQYKGDKECATSFTFDDGLPEHLSIVAPELEKRGWRGTFWICGSKVNGEKRVDRNYMDWKEIKELSDRGHEVSNHGWSHKKLTKLSEKDIRNEVEKNDSAILAHTGRRPTTFCFPYNSKNDLVLELTGKGRVGTRTRQYALGQAIDHERTVKRINDAVSKGEWAVWMTHGITVGYDAFKEPERFFRFLDYVKSMEEKVWVGTFHEVASYIEERNRISLSVENRGKRWIISPSLDLDPSLFDQDLTLVIEGVHPDAKARQDGKDLDIHIKGNKSLIDFNPYGGRITIKF